jgi:muramidase (phage lysozyme)
MASSSPYRLYGGATRPDAISGLADPFEQALNALYYAAPPEVQRELGLNSAFRDIETQRKLWNASDKSGKRAAAPGRSKHNFGEAADLFGFGLTKDRVSQQTIDWVHQNAGKHGLGFPMDYEPWHIQLLAGQQAVEMKAAGYSDDQIRQAFLSTLAGPESGGAYDVMYGGKKFSDFSRHPHQAQTVGDITSDVAGKYQFKGSTWDELAGKYGYKDFSPANQDAAAWQYASDVYKLKTGGDLFEALKSNDPARLNAAAQVLNKTWTSLPGGGEQSRGYGTSTFADAYQKALGGAAGGSGGSGNGLGMAAASGAAGGLGGAGAAAALPKTASPFKLLGEKLGEGLAGMGGGGAGGFQMPQQQPQPAPARVDQPAVSLLDPQQAESRRAMLAQALARLNQGSLV